MLNGALLLRWWCCRSSREPHLPRGWLLLLLLLRPPPPPPNANSFRSTCLSTRARSGGRFVLRPAACSGGGGGVLVVGGVGGGCSMQTFWLLFAFLFMWQTQTAGPWLFLQSHIICTKYISPVWSELGIKTNVLLSFTWTTTIKPKVHGDVHWWISECPWRT